MPTRTLATQPGRFAGLTPLLAPRSIAILGASNDPSRIGGRPIAYMKAQNFQGAIYPVNPNRTEVQGVNAYPSVADLPETPDVAIVAVPAALAVQPPRRTSASAAPRPPSCSPPASPKSMPKAQAAQDRMVAIGARARHAHPRPQLPRRVRRRTGYYATFSSSFDSGWPVPGRIGIASAVRRLRHASLYAWRATAASAPRSAS